LLALKQALLAFKQAAAFLNRRGIACQGNPSLPPAVNS